MPRSSSDLRRRRVPGAQFREYLLDQMLVAVARIRARLVPHHHRLGHLECPSMHTGRHRPITVSNTGTMSDQAAKITEAQT